MKNVNNVVIYTKSELSSESMVWATDHYNLLAKSIGLKAVKKFRDKPTAISRTLDAQETYQEDVATAAKLAAKESKAKSKPSTEQTRFKPRLLLSQ